MGRRCSHRASNGRSSSRTCTDVDYSCCTAGASGGRLRLFGVQLRAADSSDSDAIIKKSFDVASSSAARFPSFAPSANSSTSSSLLSIGKAADKDVVAGGYLSDGLVARAQERKKGVPWTEEEHRAFLAGLEKLGKGDWRGISRYFVTSRTPTQVASHAQKFFLRQITSPSDTKKRRSSLFDAAGSGGGGGGASVPRPNGKDAAISHASAASSDRRGTGRGRAAIDLNSTGTGEDSAGQTPPGPTSPAPCTQHEEQDDRLRPSRSASPSQGAGETMPPPQPAALRPPSLELTIASPIAEQRSSPPGIFLICQGRRRCHLTC